MKSEPPNVSLILTFAAFCASVASVANGQYFVDLIGNNLRPSGQGIDSPGVIVLLDTPFLKDGVVFAIKAYFRNLDETAFQIWRPSSNSSQMFTLVAELQIIPSTNTELIYITSKFMKCIRVGKGDRFGVYSFSKPSSVAYAFNPRTSQALTYAAANQSIVQVGQTANFNSITFPYDLSCQVFYYLDDSTSVSSNETNVDCPPNLTIDNALMITTSPIPISSGMPGIIGPKGPVGFPGFDGPSGVRGEQGATGPQGPLGVPGSKGSPGAAGSTGSPGPKGPMGDNGDPGQVAIGLPGQPGAAGRPGPPGHLIQVNASQAPGLESNPVLSSDWSRKWTSEMFMIGLLIWLAILSSIVLVLLLCLVIVTCVICSIRRHDERFWTKIQEFHHHEKDPYKMIRKTLASETEMSSMQPSSVESPDGTMRKEESTDAPTLEKWMGDMKEDSVHEYKMWYGVQ